MPRGALLGHFVLWYGFLRIFVDLFREYRVDFLGLPPGQEFNVAMTLLGAALLALSYRRRIPSDTPAAAGIRIAARLWPLRLAFVVLLLVPLVIPSDWTQDVPKRYGDRHPGMTHSILYPQIE
ncbi:MAG: hypothetical protein ABFS86_07225 [Planctomycetota bacterium]